MMLWRYVGIAPMGDAYGEITIWATRGPVHGQTITREASLTTKRVYGYDVKGRRYRTLRAARAACADIEANTKG